jgi:hypothetical protein
MNYLVTKHWSREKAVIAPEDRLGAIIAYRVNVRFNASGDAQALPDIFIGNNQQHVVLLF